MRDMASQEGRETSRTRHIGMAGLRLLLVAATAWGLAGLVPIAAGLSQSGLRGTTLALGALLALLLFRPLTDTRSKTMLAWSAAVTVLTAALILVDTSISLAWPQLMRLSVTLFLLAATLLLLTRIVPLAVVIAIGAALTFIPLWGAPLVEALGNSPWLNRLVLWSSPLTTFAVAIDLDYLRAEWFYAASALGSMRYRYPDWTSIALLLAVIPAVAVFFERLRVPQADNHLLAEEVDP